MAPPSPIIPDPDPDSVRHYRLDVDGPQPGQWNMDRDSEMLERALAGETAVRLYQWSEPTVSIGHFQAGRSIPVPERFAGLPVVTRLTGGGAILHHHELTYACSIPKDHPLAGRPGELYDRMHAAIIRVLREWGVESAPRGNAAFEDQSFLCFSRGDARDIVIGRDKIVGSAQRRRQGAVLQHGSLLLRRSEWTPEFPGIEDLTGIVLDTSLLVAELAREFISSLVATDAEAELSLLQKEQRLDDGPPRP